MALRSLIRCIAFPTPARTHLWCENHFDRKNATDIILEASEALRITAIMHNVVGMPGLTQRLEVALVRHKLEVLEAADPLGRHGVGVLFHPQLAEELAETAATTPKRL